MWLTWIALVPKTKHTQQQQKFVQNWMAMDTMLFQQTDISILYLIVTVRLFKVDLEERIFKYVLQGQP